MISTSQMDKHKKDKRIRRWSIGLNSFQSVLLLYLFFMVISDLHTDRIPNGFLLTGILTGLFGSFWQYGVNGLLQSAVSMAAAFLLTYPVFKIGALGGGDIKVFLVIGSFLPVRECLVIMAAAFLAGGVFSVGKLLAEKNGRERLYYFLSYVGEVARSGHFRIYGEDWKEDRVRYRKNKIHFTVPILIGAALRIGGLI